jgi:hypothetical protein
LSNETKATPNATAPDKGIELDHPKHITPTEIVTLPLSETETLDRFNRTQHLKHSLIDPKTDMILIAGKPYIKKSGWRKLQFAFNLTDEIIHEEKEQQDAKRIWRMWVEVTAPNGRKVIGVASASSDEKKFSHPDHDPYALCHTRAKNRAISDILGLGEVSAEEMLSDAPVEVESQPVDTKEVGTATKPEVPTPTTPSPEPASHDIKSTQQVTTPSQQKPTMKETPADRPTQVEGWKIPVSIETPTMPGLEREIIKRDGHNVGTRLILGDEAAFIVARPVDPKDSALTTFLQNQILEAMKGKHQGEFQYQYVIENGMFHGLLVRARGPKEILSLNSPCSWAFLKALSRESKKGSV